MENNAMRYGQFTGTNGNTELSPEARKLKEMREQLMAEATANEELEHRTSGIEFISVDDIEASRFNEFRDVSEDRITTIAESIRKIGLLNPIVVFKNSNGKYTIYGGHVRTAAWRYLISTDPSWPHSIPCRVFPAPSGNTEKEIERSEMEMQSQAEIHRYTRKDVEKEVMRADELWQNYLSEEEKAKKREEYLISFKERNSSNPLYQEDTEKYIRNNFRPRLEYIREITGITAISDRTIRRMLNARLKANNEDELATEEKEPVERIRQNKISAKKVCKKFAPVYDYAKAYCDQFDADEKVRTKLEEIMNLIDELNDMQ